MKYQAKTMLEKYLQMFGKLRTDREREPGRVDRRNGRERRDVHWFIGFQGN